MEHANQTVPQPSYLIGSLKLSDDQKPPEGEQSKEGNEQTLITFKDNSTYKGSWQDGKKHGKGELSLSNSDKYNGNFIQDKLEGKGTYIFSNGQQYEGDWADNKYNGKGKFIYAEEHNNETNEKNMALVNL